MDLGLKVVLWISTAPLPLVVTLPVCGAVGTWVDGRAIYEIVEVGGGAEIMNSGVFST